MDEQTSRPLSAERQLRGTAPARWGVILGWLRAVLLALLIFAIEVRIASVRSTLDPHPTVSGGGARFPPAALDGQLWLIVLFNLCVFLCVLLALDVLALAIPRPRRPRTWVFNLCCVLSFLALGYNAELAIRNFCQPYGKSFLFRPDADLFWTYNPDGEVSGFVINRDGFRGLDFPVGEKAPNEFRILTLGDSISAGHMLPERKTYPFLLRSMLQRAHPELLIRVQNCAVNGFSVSQGAAVLELLQPGYQPDLVIVGHSYCEIETVDPNGAPLPSHRPPVVGLRRLLYKSMLFQFLRNAINGDADFFPGPGRGFEQQPQREFLYRQCLERLVTWARAHGVRLAMYYPMILNDRREPPSGLNGNAASMSQLAAQFNIPFLDLGSRWALLPDLQARLPDGCHPDAAGTVRQASDLADFLTEQKLVPRR